MIQHLHHRTDGASFRVIGAVNQAFEPGMDQRACAHRARFNCSKQLAVFQAMVAESGTGFTQRDDLGVGGGIAISEVAIAASADDLAAAHHDRAHRNFSRLQRALSGAESFLHEKFVGAGLVGLKRVRQEGVQVARHSVESLHRMLRQHRRQQRQARTERLIHENIFSRALGQQVSGVRRQSRQRVFAEFFRNKDKHAVGTAPEGRELLVVQKCGRHVGIVRSDFQVGAEASVINPHMAMRVERNARAGIEIAVLDDLILGTQVGKDRIGQRSRGHPWLEALESPVGGKEK